MSHQRGDAASSTVRKGIPETFVVFCWFVFFSNRQGAVKLPGDGGHHEGVCPMDTNERRFLFIFPANGGSWCLPGGMVGRGGARARLLQYIKDQTGLGSLAISDLVGPFRTDQGDVVWYMIVGFVGLREGFHQISARRSFEWLSQYPQVEWEDQCAFHRVDPVSVRMVKFCFHKEGNGFGVDVFDIPSGKGGRQTALCQCPRCFCGEGCRNVVTIIPEKEPICAECDRYGDGP